MLSMLFKTPRAATRSAFLPTLLARTAISMMGIAGLAGATLLVAPAAFSAEPMSHYHHHVWGKTPEERAETVEQRIRTLHVSLHITPAQEANWTGVAQTMRDNETRLQDMITAREAEPKHHVTAPEDLRTYERFTQAHVEGLKMLRASFETLYTSMPDDQKLIADDVFDKFGNGHD
jgi:hypothetical protein